MCQIRNDGHLVFPKKETKIQAQGLNREFDIIGMKWTNMNIWWLHTEKVKNATLETKSNGPEGTLLCKD